MHPTFQELSSTLIIGADTGHSQKLGSFGGHSRTLAHTEDDSPDHPGQ
jgi:hypothetical protein